MEHDRPGDSAEREKAGEELPRPRIRALDPRVVSKIAAGEMILRPSSVAKELIENALDAGARAIEVALGDSPDQRIEVSDDGCGMIGEDLLVALQPHATSKLASEDDLLRITTLGFRGEALPSIGRVARMEITTSSGADGARVVVEGGDRRLFEPAARARGTTVRVEDLFFNSPVRKRFLKSAESEVRLIVKCVAASALACPHVSFRLRSRGEPLLELPAAGTLAARIAQIHGPSFAEKILPLDGFSAEGRITGYIGIPELARPGTQHQTLLVNGRWVSASWLSSALRQGYGDLLPGNRHPFALVLLTCDPGRIDVNVHPTKREIRFLDESALFGALVRAVRARTSALVPGWNLDPRDAGSGRPWESSGLGRTAHPHDARGMLGPPGQEVLNLLYGRSAETLRAGMDGQPAVRDAEFSGGEESAPDAAGAVPPGGNAGPDGTETPGHAEDGLASATMALALGAAGVTAGPPAEAPNGLVPLWQLHQRYLFAPTRQGFLVIDQHAAHERILYEQALANLRGAGAATQQLLFPLPLTLDPEEAAVFREFAQQMENLGIDAEEFGKQTLLLRGVPVFWDRDPEGHLRDLLHELATTRGGPGRREERLAASFACRSAVRSGQALTLEEMNALVDQLFATSVPHGDPHGRPTFLQISLADLDRRFGRSG